ncbi:endonuclease/exonuclease/phosphatase family protein [Rhodococcus sp. Z13]|uniref:Endonuclease/exonuclease/phosphatase family protein n=1 Tax=Rhodococcus sacchari TaxID=2962047 RepID=A0ACD4DIS6_9NOCA|nr:endonuclease/exonuclease/phosphatase family protein [Rhodococcus sp. Z13]UYP19941.1 endonuclease/exonuclease/phosphatase family protein [Rhodococcus sp. Z13]
MTIRRAVEGLALVAVATGALGVVVHYLGPESNKLILLSSFVPLLVVVGIAGTLVLAAIRAWRSALIGLLVVLAGVWTQLPLFVPSRPSFPDRVAGEPITVLQANIRLGEADAEGVVDLVRQHDADVVTVEELTDDAVVRLREAGIDELLPEQYLKPRPEGGGGTGIYSRFPLRNAEPLGRFAMENLVADLEVGDGRTVLLAVVHPMPPYPEPAWRWAAEMEKLGVLLRERASAGTPVIVSGDFNSTWSHTRYRSLLTDGFVDAADQTGAGLLLSYPADTVYPAMIGIDRIITRGATVDRPARVDIPGSDHHGLVASVTPWFE